FLTSEDKPGADLSGVRVESNIVARCGSKGSAAFSVSGVRDSRFTNNLAYKNLANGFVFYRSGSAAENSGNIVAGNTIYFEQGKGRSCLTMRAGCRDFTVKNNVFFGGRGGALAIHQDSREGLVCDFNLITNHPDQVLIGEKYPHDPPEEGFKYPAGQWQFEIGFDRNSKIGVDPGFVSIEDDDYHLRDDSPARDAAGAAALYLTDMEGNARPSGAAFDIGCYEHTGPVAAAETPPLRGGERRVAVLQVEVLDDASGAPIPSAEVTLQVNADTKTARTDDDGHYSFRLFEEAVQYLKIEVAKAPYAPMRFVWEKYGGQEFPGKIALRLLRGVTIGGAVMTTQGEPIEGATVSVTVADDRFALEDLRVTTDAEGKWQADCMPPDVEDIVVKVSHEEYTAGKIAPPAIALLRQGAAITVLRQKYRLEGFVRGPDGAPVEPTVLLGRDRYSGAVSSVRGDNDGRFVFDDAGSDRVTITVTAPGCAPHCAEVAAGRGLKPLEITLSEPRVLRGRVVTALGSAVEGASVSLSQWRGVQMLSWSARTDERGRFEWNDAPHDVVFLRASKDGFFSSSAEVTAGEGETVIALNPKAVGKGTVTDAATGEPVDAFTITLGEEPATSDQLNWNHEETAEFRGGTYQLDLDYRNWFRGVNEYWIRVDAPGYSPASRPVQLGETVIEMDFALEECEGITGVVKAADGTPVKGVEVALVDPKQMLYIQNGNLSRTSVLRRTTGADGRFWFADTGEDCRIVAAGDAGLAETSREELKASPDVVLAPWGRLEGTILSAGKPAAGVHVSLDDWPWQTGGYREGEIRWSYGARTDEEGRFVFGRARPGMFLVSWGDELRSPDGTFIISPNHRLPVEAVAGESVSVTLGRAACAVSGRVRLPDSPSVKLNLENARLTLIGTDLDARLPENVRAAGTEAVEVWLAEHEEFRSPPPNVYRARHYTMRMPADGVFRFRDMAPGEYQLQATIYTDKGRFEATRRLEVKVGAEEMDVGVLGFRELGPLEVGNRAADFSLETLDGGTASLAALEGRYVLLHFWSLVNRRARKDVVALKALADEFASDERLSIISVSVGDDEEQLRSFVSENELAWAQCTIPDFDAAVAMDYQLRGLPLYILVGPDRKVLAASGDVTEISVTVRGHLRKRSGP
ncbi:MAG: carboxypeptidase regulatory-like domain-containing protein, partial [Planctomycetota bacterium]